MSRFDDCLAFVLAREGGYVDDPTDRGGATNNGITQHTYDVFRVKHDMPRQPVADMQQVEVAQIYRESYWQPMHCDELGAPVDLVLFDSAVQHGVVGAVRLLQRALAIPEDGVLGPVTLRGARCCLADAIIHQRRDYYDKIVRNDPTQQKFSAGWANRLNALEGALA